jgi:hypothetical protein
MLNLILIGGISVVGIAAISLLIVIGKSVMINSRISTYIPAINSPALVTRAGENRWQFPGEKIPDSDAGNPEE